MIVLFDTREKEPWDLSFYNIEMQRRKVTTGDYTIEGMEDILSIERKKSTGEIAINLGQKWEQFEKELDRMLEIKHCFLVCEFEITDISKFPVSSGIPERDWPKLRMNGNYMQKKLFGACEKRGIELIFCSDKAEAEKEVAKIVKSIYSRYQK